MKMIFQNKLVILKKLMITRIHLNLYSIKLAYTT